MRILIAIGVGTFMSALDGSAVNSILPVIEHAFGSGIATIEWVVTIYLLVVSAILLSFGRLGDLRGHRPLYLTGFVIFIASSALCGLAPSPGGLIAARGVQSLGAAMLFANSPAILTKAFPAEERGRTPGLLATMTYLGLTVGPSLGGWLTDGIGWRSVFYVNVPVGIAAFLLAVRFIPRDEPAETRQPFDLAGAAAFTSGLVLLLLALNRGHDWGWGSAGAILVLIASGILLAAFVAIERRVKAPMLDLKLFRDRVFSAAAASAGLNYIAVFTAIFLMPFYLIQGRGLSPGKAGTLLSVQPLVMAAAAPLSGILSDRIGARAPSTLGMALLSAGMLMLARLGPATPWGGAVVALSVVGLGTGIFISPNSSALMGAAPRQQQGIAGGILATARNLGMVLGVGLAGAVFTTSMAHGAGVFRSIRAGFLAAAVVAAFGVVISGSRGARRAGAPPGRE